MGKFEELKELIDMIEELDGDDDIEVRVITSKEELDKRVKELEEDGYTLIGDAKKDEKEDKKVMEKKLEEERQKAIKAKERIIKAEGKEKADDFIAFAASRATIKACVELDIPIREDMIKEYHDLCKKVYPEKSNPMFLALAYSFIDHLKEEGVKSLE